MRSRLGKILLSIFLICIIGIPAYAAPADTQATEITSIDLITDSSGFPSLKHLFNNKYWETQKTEDTAYLTLEYQEGIGSLYLTFMYAYGEYTVTNNDNGATYTAGTDLFIHEFIDLVEHFGSAPSSVTISFENGPAQLHELDVFTPGQVPDSVQKWEHPEEGKVDLILFASHSDDDQLFFAGLLPYYAVERGYEVMVVYLTDHHNTAPGRVHEVLTGLWAVGVRNYPVVGYFEDFGNANSADQAFQYFAKYGHSREEMTGFVVEQLRRFKPMVAVGHDIKGEYGHAQHKAYSQLVMDAVAVSSDPLQHPDSAERYGTWDVPKTYLHLYKENKIVMDWDQPMENFNGMTPYQVTKKLGFPVHVSQQKGWAWYFNGYNTAASIKDYSPCKYGLYRSTVGVDVEKNDMFENLLSHAELAPPIPETEPPVPETEPTIPETEPAGITEPLPTEAPEPAPTLQPTPATEAPSPDPSTSVPSQDSLIRWIIVEVLLVLMLVVLLILKRNRRNRG